ncbi:Caffeic acid 3-O-methyltransferase 1 [Asimina triloba]
MAPTPNRVEVSSETEECAFAMVLSSAYAFPMTLKAAIELDVLEIIAKAGPAAQLSAAEIASHITTKNAGAPIMLDRILRLLASYSILTCAHRTLHNGQLERLYGLAPVCKFLVRNEDGVSMAPLLCTIHNKVFMETW